MMRERVDAKEEKMNFMPFAASQGGLAYEPRISCFKDPQICSWLDYSFKMKLCRSAPDHFDHAL